MPVVSPSHKRVANRRVKARPRWAWLRYSCPRQKMVKRVGEPASLAPSNGEVSDLPLHWVRQGRQRKASCLTGPPKHSVRLGRRPSNRSSLQGNDSLSSCLESECGTTEVSTLQRGTLRRFSALGTSFRARALRSIAPRDSLLHSEIFSNQALRISDDALRTQTSVGCQVRSASSCNRISNLEVLLEQDHRNTLEHSLEVRNKRLS